MGDSIVPELYGAGCFAGIQEEPESVEEQICKNCGGVIRSLDKGGESCDLGSP